VLRRAWSWCCLRTAPRLAEGGNRTAESGPLLSIRDALPRRTGQWFCASLYSMASHRRLAFWLYLGALFAIMAVLHNTTRAVRLPVGVIGALGLAVMFWRIDPRFFREQFGSARLTAWLRSRR
jgi:hypothetical protein